MPPSHLLKPAGPGMWCFTPPRVLLREECSPLLAATPALPTPDPCLVQYIHALHVASLHIQIPGGKSWLAHSVHFLYLSYIAVFLSCSNPHSFQSILPYTAHHVYENNGYKCFGTLHSFGRTSIDSMSCRDGLSISSPFEAQPINPRKSHRLQHEGTSRCQRIRLPLQRLPTRSLPTSIRHLRCRLDIQHHFGGQRDTRRRFMSTLTILRPRSNIQGHQKHDRRMPTQIILRFHHTIIRPQWRSTLCVELAE